ncbi:endolytic transglycosylase MltG [Vaginisenegalia massiliensis]|uniref:endolytic transglycosylase MltG n=1 Tax=Vaginisenegalia massiliensis TaxID=2058294 RepID=UPI000F520506|nr:endolytic transglycosylase MltG [Vaginisenegalia massiliensis]
MNKEHIKTERANSNSQQNYKIKERAWTNRIVKTIILTIVTLGVLGIISGLAYFKYALGPVDSHNQKEIQVTVPINSSNKGIAKVLEKHGLIRNADVFIVYLKSKSIGNLKAGHYQLKQSMNVDQVIAQLQKGGIPISAESDNKIVVKEGMQVEDIAKEVEAKTDISAKEFLKLVNDDKFIATLQSKYPDLLAGVSQAQGLKYKLEGYLAPATYDYMEGNTGPELITEMVSKANIEYQKLEADIPATGYSYHQLLTLASIVEKEGITPEDRGLIAGVFLNRLNAGMPLQSDITVLYALGKHKEMVTYKDLEIDSPYNLYKNSGLAPGPFNSPSVESINAVIHPTPSNYYYFVADLKTQKVYFSATQEEHEALVAKYVNQENQSDSTTVSDQSASSESQSAE